MIRINLLPVRASKKQEAGKQWLLLFALTLVGALVGNYFWWSQTDAKLELINARITKYQQEVATLNKIIGEVKNIKAEKKAMEDKLLVLKKLRDGRTGPVRVFDELATLIPQRVWLTNYEEGGGTVNFAGAGSSHEEVANFVKKLKSSKFFSNPQIKSQRQTGENKVEFNISGAVKYSA